MNHFAGDALPNLLREHVDIPGHDQLGAARRSTHPPRILLLYGTLRERSYSRLLTLEDTVDARSAHGAGRVRRAATSACGR